MEQTTDLNIHQPGAPSTGLLQILQKGVHTDVTFQLNGQVLVKAHRVILASQSEYFECLLYGPMKEGRASKITLHETPPEAFQQLLTFIYSGALNTKIAEDTCLDLLTLADRFGFVYLKTTIAKKLLPLINVENALLYNMRAERSSASLLLKGCQDFINENAAAVIKSSTFCLLPQMNLKELISRDSFMVDEIHIFRAVQKWMDYNSMGKEDASELLECVRLTEMTPEQLEEEVRPSGLYDDDRVVKAIVKRKGTVLHGMTPRGKSAAGLNLFTVSSTKLLNCNNYMLEFRPGMGDNWSCVSDFFFRLVLPAVREPGCITVQFDGIHIINQITFVGTPGLDDDDSDHNFCYQVWVSRDENTWVTIVNYSHIQCHSTQRLFFSKVAVKFIRIVVTKGFKAFTIHLVQCGYRDTPYSTKQYGILAPCVPLTPVFSNFVRATEHKFLCSITFCQPYSISKLRLQLKGLNCSGNVSVCVSAQTNDKISVGMFKDFDLTSTMETTFVERVVSKVNVTITKITAVRGCIPIPEPIRVGLINVS